MTTALALIPSAELAPVLEQAPSPMLAYLAGLGSETSRRTQASALHTVARWAGYPDGWAFPWHTWTAAKQTALRGHVATRTAPSYGNRLLGAVRGVCEACWLADPPLMSGETLARIKAVDSLHGHREPRGRALEPSEVAALFEAAAVATVAGLRDTALLALLAGGALRIHEACRAELADYDAARPRLSVVGKGNKQRVVDLPPRAAADIAPWLGVRGPSPGPLLWAVSPQDEPRPVALRPRGAARAIERLADLAAVKLSTHDFRRTVISALLPHNDLALVARIAGHSKVTTTAAYDRRPQEACAQVMRRYAYRPER